ncbi:MAG: C25 family cysteine peptidase [Thermoplasmata archaeon]
MKNRLFTSALITMLVLSGLMASVGGGAILEDDWGKILDEKIDTFSDHWEIARSSEHSGDIEPVMIRYVEQKSDEVVIQYKMPEPVFKEVPYQHRHDQIAYRMGFGNNDLFSEPGRPEIPSLPVRIVIPRGHVVDSVNVEPDDLVTVPGRYLLSYAEEPLPITCEPREKPSTLRDELIYGSDDVYPHEQFEYHGIQYGMGIAVAHISIYPVEYKPLSGDLQYYGKFTLRVNTAPDASAYTDLRVDIGRFEDRLGSSMDNLAALDTYIDGEMMGNQQNIVNPMDSYSYVFITSEAVAEDGTVDPSVDDLITHRMGLGYTSTVVTTEYIYANYNGNNNFYRVRNFIKDAYNNWDTEFVTLGGDTNIIPYTTVYDSVGEYSENIPTDLPLQCLDGDVWDEDFHAELMIGRISGNNAGEISNQIHKILKYETEPQRDGYFQTGLGVAEKLDDDTYGKEAMLDLQTYFSDEWSWDGLYDQDGTWGKQQIIDLINMDHYSVINHLGHSNYNYNMKMYNGDETSFTNTNYIFIKSQGCIPGAFDSDCITERFTTQRNTGGMFAAVMNSRYGWYNPVDPTGGPSHQLHRAFWYGAWDLNMDYFSEFNEYSHRTQYTYSRWDALSSNYFGCAATRFRGKEIPGEPPSVTVTRPDGEEVFTAGEQEQITWTATPGDDPVDYMQLSYSVNAGTSWTPIATGLPNTGSYDWTVPNEDSTECLVRVQAKDELGRIGENVSDSVFQMIGTPPTPPETPTVEHASGPCMTVFDDFTDGNYENWTVYDGTWAASEGYLQGHGTISIPSELNGEHIDAYGRWEIDFQLAETSDASGYQLMRYHFIQIDNPDSRYASGYYIIITGSIDGGNGQINLWRWDSGSTPGDTTISSSWSPNTNINTLTVEREQNGAFSMYLNGDLLGTGTDNTYTTNEYNGIRNNENPSGGDEHIIHEIRVEVMGEDNEHNRLTWNASIHDPAEVSRYNIYRSETHNGPWDESTLTDSVAADGSARYEYLDENRGMADEIYWWYVIRAVGTNGLEEQNEEVFQEPGAPMNVFDISLHAGGDADGWNLVSFNLAPGDTSLTSILASIEGDYDRVMYYNASSNSWSSYVPERGEHFNNLHSWNHRMGIWIQVTEDTILTVEGMIPMTTDITLYPGWNMVGLPSSTSGDHGSPPEVTIVGYFDVTAEYNLAYDHDPANYTFEPGKGYWVYNGADEAVVWTVEY